MFDAEPGMSSGKTEEVTPDDLLTHGMSREEQVCVPEIWLTTTPMSTMKTTGIDGRVALER